MGELPHEVIYQVEFPERPGALRKFLSVLRAPWNITLFHYRRSGEPGSEKLLLVCMAYVYSGPERTNLRCGAMLCGAEGQICHAIPVDIVFARFCQGW